MNSEEYWKNREAEQRKHNIRDEKEYQKHLNEIYQNMIDEIEKEIHGFYSKYASKEGITMAEAKKRASKADIEALGRKAKKYVKEKDFSKQANDEMRLYNLTMKVNRLELLKSQIGLEMVSGFDEMQKFFEKILGDRAVEEFKRQAGILGKTVKNNEKFAKAIVNASFHNATFSDRIWMYQDMLKNELNSLLQTGLIRGQNPRVLATHLRKRFGASRSNAERLMITELARVQTEAQMQSFKRNGFTEYTFHALGTACPKCKAIDGKHFKIKDAMPGKNASPLHPRCRCSTSAYMDDEEYTRWLSGTEINSGAVAGAWNDINDPIGEKRRKIGDELYEEIKNRKKKYEVAKVSRNTKWPVKDVGIVYDHIFVNKHLFEDGSIRRFDSDYYMAHSWIRLTQGKNIQKHDMIMLQHELEEAIIMLEDKNMTYEKAHSMAEEKYNYNKALIEYLIDHDA